MKIVDDDTVFDNRNDDNDVPDGRSKANTMMTTMDLDNYEPSYDSYALFHTATRVNNYSNNIISLRKTYPEAYQGRGPHHHLQMWLGESPSRLINPTTPCQFDTYY